jgi:hypothetical protein
MERHSRLSIGSNVMRTVRGIIAIALGIGASASFGEPALQSAKTDAVRTPGIGKTQDPDRWDKLLTGTYWYVPTDALPAEFHVGSTVMPVEQQTIYYIEKSHRGVFSGWMVTQFTTQPAGLDLPISCQDMFGTIAPRGEISLTVVTPASGVVAHPWPVSYMSRVNGEWLTMVLASMVGVVALSFIGDRCVVVCKSAAVRQQSFGC